MEKDYLFGNYNQCLISLKNVLERNTNNLSIMHNIAITEWCLLLEQSEDSIHENENNEKNKKKENIVNTLQQIIQRRNDEHENMNEEDLIFSYNLCVLYFSSGMCEKAKDLLLPLVEKYSTNEQLLLPSSLLLSEIFFTLAKNNRFYLKSFPYEWNILMNNLTTCVKTVETQQSPPSQSKNYLTFRFHLLNCRFYITSNQFKSAKKEIKLAMEVYYHQIKKLNPLIFAKLRFCFSSNHPEISNLIETAINLNREMVKEGCLVHFLKAYIELRRDNPLKSLKLLISEPFEQFQNSKQFYSQSSSSSSSSSSFPIPSPYSSRSMDCEYYNNLGCTYFGLGHFYHAYSSFKRSLKSNHPTRHTITESILFNQGLTLMKLSRPSEAIDCFKTIVNLMKTQQWMVYFRIAECSIQIYTKQLNQIKTGECGNNSVPIDKRIYHLDQRLSSSFSPLRENERHLLEALKYFELALQGIQLIREEISSTHQSGQSLSSGGSSSSSFSSTSETNIDELQIEKSEEFNMMENYIYLNLTFIHVSLRDWLRALRVGQRLLQNPSVVENIKYPVRQYIAECYCHLGHFSQAVNLLEIKSDPNSNSTSSSGTTRNSYSEQLCNLEVVKLLQGNFLTSENQFLSHLDQHPHSIPLRNNLAFIYLKLQLREKARHIQTTLSSS